MHEEEPAERIQRVILTNTDVNLPRRDLARDDVDRLETGGTLPVGRADGDGVRDTSVERGHTRGRRASARRKDVANGDVAHNRRVNTRLLHGSAEHAREELFWPGVLEATLLALYTVIIL